MPFTLHYVDERAGIDSAQFPRKFIPRFQFAVSNFDSLSRKPYLGKNFTSNRGICLRQGCTRCNPYFVLFRTPFRHIANPQNRVWAISSVMLVMNSTSCFSSENHSPCNRFSVFNQSISSDETLV